MRQFLQGQNFFRQEFGEDVLRGRGGELLHMTRGARACP